MMLKSWKMYWYMSITWKYYVFLITVELTEPPYHIHDSGYASFGLKIDVFFRTPVNPKERQIHYEYDLFLPGVGQPTVSSFKTERLQFINPPPTFRAMLIAGGAVSVFSCKLTFIKKLWIIQRYSIRPSWLLTPIWPVCMCDGLLQTEQDFSQLDKLIVCKNQLGNYPHVKF